MLRWAEIVIDTDRALAVGLPLNVELAEASGGCQDFHSLLLGPQLDQQLPWAVLCCWLLAQPNSMVLCSRRWSWLCLYCQPPLQGLDLLGLLLAAFLEVLENLLDGNCWLFFRSLTLVCRAVRLSS